MLDKAKFGVLTYFNVIIVVVYIGLLSMSSSCCLSRFCLCDEVVHLNITLPDLFLFDPLFIFAILFIDFLLIGVLMINTVIKVLVVQLFIVSIELSDSRMEPD
jgi:hypothetical protein